jgi:hypothetical protein
MAMEFAYDRRPVIINMIIWAIVTLWLLLLLFFLFPEQRALYISIMGSMAAISLLIIGVSPLLTSHEILDKKIFIRQGWHSHLIVPVDQVRRVQRLERIEAKEGVLLDAFSGTLVLTDSKTKGIRMELKKEMRAPTAFWKKVNVVIFDVDDPDRFIAEFERSL